MVNLPIEYSDKPVTPFGGMTLAGDGNYYGTLSGNAANVGATLPLGGDSFAATSLYFTQGIGKRTVLMVGKINAVDLVRAGSVAVGGKGGGGRPDMAQGGGPDGTKGAEAIAAVKGVLAG